jgi:hypothetical protein
VTAGPARFNARTTVLPSGLEHDQERAFDESLAHTNQRAGAREDRGADESSRRTTGGYHFDVAAIVMSAFSIEAYLKPRR